MSVTFDLTGSGSGSSSLPFTAGGITLVVTSGLFNGDTGGDFLVYENSPLLNQTAAGLGMLNPYGDFETQIDGHGKKEVAILSFSQAVEITSIGFTPIGTSMNPTGEDVSFMLFGNGLISQQVSTLIDADNVNAVSLFGLTLGIGAHSQLDGFRITSITVDTPVTVTYDDVYSLSRSEADLSLSILQNDRGARSISAVNTAGLVGSVAISADGQSLIYTKGTAFSNLIAGQTVTETFSSSVLGWDGLMHTEVVSVTINGAGGQNFITGTSSGNKLTGTAVGDTIDGLAGADTLNGGAGDDVILGGLGKDKIDGQTGADEMIGGADSDTYYVDNVRDVVIELSGEGTDSVYASASFTLSSNVEKLYLTGSANLKGTGNSLANTLTGNSGDNVLVGGDGKDSLDGGAGSDTMIGGTANDAYTVDNAGDVIIEQFGGGLDTVKSSIDYVLGDQVEYLTLTGTAALSGTGNGSQNIMTGNGGANVLTGLAGNDKIVAGLGADTIIGGVGKDSVTGGGDADTFVFAEFGSANADTIADFVHGQDKISLSSAAFGLAAGTLPDAIFAQGTAATTAAQRILYDQVKGDIWYDPDGSGAAAKQLVASLTDGLAITSSDFLIF